MKCAWLLVSVVAATASPAAALPADIVPGRYLWPLDGYTRVSAGFCDYRTRHYHGGIDISTGGREGLPVHAADSGWVLRASTSWWAFGKVLYIRMPDGHVAVYGHLSEFAPRIQDFVEAAQYDAERYQQNLMPAPGQIPIARGEVVAKTGQTGAGPPHLHFELRTAENRPINPLNGRFDKTDRIPPTIHSVTLVPRQPDTLDSEISTVAGSLLPLTYRFWGPVGERRLAETPAVTGTIGVAVLADDEIDSGAGTVSPYRLTLHVNDRTVSDIRYDSINYDQTRLIDLERLFEPDPGIAPRATDFFRREGNTLWHYDSLANEGWLAEGTGLSIGDNRIQIDVADAAGNISRATFSLTLAARPERVIGVTLGAHGPEITPSWNGLVIRFAASVEGNVRCFADSDGKHPLRGFAWSRPGDRSSKQAVWSGWLPAMAGIDTIWIGIGGRDSSALRPYPLEWRAVPRGQGGTIHSPDGKAYVTIAPDDLYASTFLSLRPTGRTDGAAHALGPLYELAPDDIPLSRDVQLSISYPSLPYSPEKLAIYRGAGGTWDFSGNEIDKETHVVNATIPRTGTYTILTDTTRPTIRDLSPGAGAKVAGRRPTVRFALSDNLAGFGSDKDVVLLIDGQWVPVEYDPELGTAKARPRWELPPGEHKLEIRARDRCGNIAAVARSFRVVR